jgi:hypothetical protein
MTSRKDFAGHPEDGLPFALFPRHVSPGDARNVWETFPGSFPIETNDNDKNDANDYETSQKPWNGASGSSSGGGEQHSGKITASSRSCGDKTRNLAIATTGSTASSGPNATYGKLIMLRTGVCAG